MTHSIDLNCDMGELIPGTTSNFDAEIMPYISSCNVACGFHSGGPVLIEKTIRLALRHGVAIGAHPSYDDRENFGRTSMEVDHRELQAQLRYQISAVKGIAEAWGGRLHHVKPHGALYNDMVKKQDLSDAVVEAIYSIDPELVVFGMSGSVVEKVCKNRNVKFVNEVFSDRRYQGPVELRNRRFEDAVLHDTNEVLDQVDLFLRGYVKDYNEHRSSIPVESICLHSDTKGAVELAKAIYKFLADQDVDIHPAS